jgi:hypothetical protein
MRGRAGNRNKEAALASNTKDQARTEASLKKKELQAREASKAMAEYEAASRALVEKTARLRSLRLAPSVRRGGARQQAAAKAKKAAPNDVPPVDPSLRSRGLDRAIR